jgi:hypothetical protein
VGDQSWDLQKNLVLQGFLHSHELGTQRKGGKAPIKQARRRYLLQAAGEYKKALKRRDGTQGAASAVRHIDPASIDLAECLK